MSRRARWADAQRDERGDYSIFVAVMVIGLLVLGGVAYEAPRIMAVRQQALHTAQQASQLAASMVAAGEPYSGIKKEVSKRVEETAPPYGQRMYLIRLQCTGNLVRAVVAASYSNVTVLSLFGSAQRMEATAAAEVVLYGPRGERVHQPYLPECRDWLGPNERQN